MRLPALWLLIRRDLSRTRGALFTSGFGIAAGTATLMFFLALGLGVRGVLLGEVFPIDKVELNPPKAEDPGLLGLILGGGEPPGIKDAGIEELRRVPGVAAVYPKLRFAFPSSGRGGKDLLGYEVGASELIGDGIDPLLVGSGAPRPAERGGSASSRPELPRLAFPFEDPLAHPGPPCEGDAACAAPAYCERASGAASGSCSDPVPALVSRYLVEIFDKSIAPAHGLPPVGETLVSRAEGVTFSLRLGESLLGRAREGAPRTVKVRVVGVSSQAIDLGLTLPLQVVQRWNREYAGAPSAARFSSAIVLLKEPSATSAVLDRGRALRLEPKDTRARDVSVLITSVMALLSLVAGVILVVSALNIAHTFRVLVHERRVEIALYRAVGATAADMRAFILGLAVVIGLLGGAVGVLVARVAALAGDQLAATELPDFPFKPATFFAFPLWLSAAGVGFAALFAALGAALPARRAARTEPAAVLSGST